LVGFPDYKHPQGLKMDFSTLSEDIRKITYSGTYSKPLQNRVIRLFEKKLVRTNLAERFINLGQRIESGEPIETATLKAFGLDVKIVKGLLSNIPKRGPVMVVGNHPFGIVDGMVISAVLRSHRKDLKVMAHQGISNLPQFQEYFLPINFDKSDQAKETNKQSVQEFKDHLGSGGIGVMYPSGAVSTKRPLWKKNCDPPWHPAVGKWSNDYNCTVIPVFIDGRCGPLFQLTSQFSMTLRLSSLLYENAKLIDSEINLRLGEPIDLKTLPKDWDIPRQVLYFREKCYGLAGLDPWGRQLESPRAFKEAGLES
jgi:putative hemolysin